MNLFDCMQNIGLTPRKCSSAHGGEYYSSCPACGDGGKGGKSDRFHIWPSKDNKGLCVGRFWCRQCDVSGDTIEFLQRFMGMDFPSACMELGISLPKMPEKKRSNCIASPCMTVQRGGWMPTDYGYPHALWREKAGNLVDDCRRRLAADSEAMSWLEGRGISRSMADKFELGYNQSSKDGDRYRPRSLWGLAAKQGRGGKTVKTLWIPRGWVIPARNITNSELFQLRIRRRNDDICKFCDNIKYLPLDGSTSATLVIYPKADVFVAVESGFDAILIAGHLHGKVGAVCTWNDSARPDVHANKVLEKAPLIIGGLDFDSAGEQQSKWWDNRYKQHRRIASPGKEIKDPGDAYAAGVNIREWVVDSLPRGLRIKLGFDSGLGKPKKDIRTEEHKKQQEEKDEQCSPSAKQVIEMELTDGTIIYITDNRGEWDRLAAKGEAVFSRHEMERINAATASMSAQDKMDFTLQVVMSKKIIGNNCGHIVAGRDLTVRGK